MQSLSVELGWALSREEKEQAPIKKMFESEGRGSEEGERIHFATLARLLKHTQTIPYPHQLPP